MHTDIDSTLTEQAFVTRPQLLDCGYDDRAVTRLVRAGVLVRIGCGLYSGAAYRDLSDDQQHVIRARAVSTRFPRGDIVFSHQTAALLSGAPVWGMDLGHVHVTRGDNGRGRRQAGVRHHVGEIGEHEITEIGGLLVTTAARTGWDFAVSAPEEQALVTLDDLLHRELTTKQELHALAREHTAWRGSRSAKVTIVYADGRSESVGESRARFVMRAFRLPEPELQYKIFGEDGALIGIADFAWPEFRHLGEFDGRVKYGTGLDLAREKAREDKLRALAWGMTRIIWSQLNPGQRRLLAEQLLAAMKQSKRLYGRVAG